MTTFTRFDDSGRYTTTISCPDECLQFENPDRIALGGADSETQYHDLATNRSVAMPTKPSKFHVFDYTTKQWLDPRTMQSRIDKTVAAIKAERDKRKSGGTLIDGKWYHSDEPSRIQQIGLVMMGAGVPAVQWKTMDGTFVAMTQTLASAIFTATATLDMALFANAEAHIAAVATCADPDVYDYSTGWPAHFSGVS